MAECAEMLDMKEDTLRKRLRRGSTFRKELDAKGIKYDVKNSHDAGK